MMQHPLLIVSLTAVLLAAATPAAAESPEAAMERLEVRKSRLSLHQGFGLASLGSMAVTAGLGLSISQGWAPSSYTTAHLSLAALTTGLYLTAATLALTAPASPFALEPEPGDPVTLHRQLAWLHAAGLVSTLALGYLRYTRSPEFAPYHGAAAGATLGVMAVSAGVIAFGF